MNFFSFSRTASAGIRQNDAYMIKFALGIAMDTSPVAKARAV
jgi:hypothetical protein